MPELAEVEFFRKQWDPGLGQKITAVALHPRNRVFRGSNPLQIKKQIAGRRFLRSQARGKRMLFEFSEGAWLGIHLGMTGKLATEAVSFRPGKHDHLVLFQATDKKGRALVFTDSRQFGRVQFHHGESEPGWWKSSVPEIATPGFDLQFVDQFLDRHGRAPIKAVLLMQSGFSGVGNWMADEILWRAHIHPATTTGNLSAGQRGQLLQQTKLVVKTAFRTLGRDFSDPPRGWLIHQKWKPGGVCPRHRTLLRHATVGGRTTAWCPRCQKSLTPRPQRGRGFS